MNLKPCPFCGGEPHIERRGNARFSTIISCLDCGVTHECGDTGDGVGNGWNRRVAPLQSITLNQYQLLRAVEQCGGIFTGSDLTIEYFDEHECDEDGEKVTRPSGLYLFWTEYPEEGSTPLDAGPLTESFECIVCYRCGNERTIANGATGTDPRGYSDCTNCSDHKGPPTTE